MDAHAAASHGGITKTYEELVRTGKHHLVKDVREVVNNCPCCVYKKLPAAFLPAQSQYTDWPQNVIQIDVGSPPTTLGGMCDGPRHVLVICDLATRHVYTEPIPSKSAFDVATALEVHCTRYGYPEKVVCDGGPEFANALMQAMSEMHESKVIFTCADYPQGHGAVERAYGTVERHMVGLHRPDAPWRLLLAWATMAINISRNATTGQAPGDLMLARSMRHPRSKHVPRNESPLLDDYAEHLKLFRGPFIDKFVEHMKAVRNKAEKKLDKRRKVGPPLAIGQMVYLANTHISNQHDFQRYGPFRVHELDQFGNAKLISPSNHVSKDRFPRARLFNAPPGTNWRAMVPHRVVSHRHNATTGGKDYLVEYRGYPPFCHDYVRDADLLQIAPRLVDAYVSDL